MTAREHDLLIQLYEHKIALYKMLDQFGYTIDIDGKSYYDDLSRSAEEATFKVLNFPSPQISAEEFYQRWDSDEGYLWTLKGLEKEFEPYHYKIYKEGLKTTIWNYQL